MTQPLVVDSHEDLAYNILNFGRDYTRPAAETRQFEEQNDLPARVHNGDTLLGWPDYQKGRVALVFSTLFVTPDRARLGDWENQVYRTYDEAHRLYHAQLDEYHRLCDQHPEKFTLVGNKSELEKVLADWETGTGDHPVGLIPLMEGAEGVRHPDELGDWWQSGVRMIGPAWRGTRFCGGTRDPGPLTEDGIQLLDGMAEIGFILDLSHMDEKSVYQALDRYPGAIIASHANAASLLPGYQGNRLLTDGVITAIVRRGGVIGVVPFNHFLSADWKSGDGRTKVPLSMVADQVDFICQLAGDALHVGLGTDFDGGFGLSSVPDGLDTIADLQKLSPLLAARGYTETDLAAVLGRNWIDQLEAHLP